MLCSTTHGTMKNKTGEDINIKFYKTVSALILLYVSELWVKR